MATIRHQSLPDTFLPLASGGYRAGDVQASANCACTIGAKRSHAAPSSSTPVESQVESSENQNNANVHCQPFPESVSDEGKSTPTMTAAIATT
jgi:hypothetical protein